MDRSHTPRMFKDGVDHAAVRAHHALTVVDGYQLQSTLQTSRFHRVAAVDRPPGFLGSPKGKVLSRTDFYFIVFVVLVAVLGLCLHRDVFQGSVFSGTGALAAAAANVHAAGEGRGRRYFVGRHLESPRRGMLHGIIVAEKAATGFSQTRNLSVQAGSSNVQGAIVVAPQTAVTRTRAKEGGFRYLASNGTSDRGALSAVAAESSTAAAHALLGGHQVSSVITALVNAWSCQTLGLCWSRLFGEHVAQVGSAIFSCSSTLRWVHQGQLAGASFVS